MKKSCWNKALNAYATAYIFSERANSLRTKQRLLTFLGIGFPSLVGICVLSFSFYEKILPFLIPVAGLAGVIQVLGSIWALIAKWDDAYAVASEASKKNTSLKNDWQLLVTQWPHDIEHKYNELYQADSRVEQSDIQRGVSDKEKRKGMRAALLQFGRKCATCAQVPKSMTASDCGVCGNF